MRIAEVLGNVTLSQCLPELEGASLRLACPLSQAALTGQAPGTAELLVVYDQLGAGCGSRIALSEGAEAAQPFRPALKPVDAYNAAIIDEIDIDLATAANQAAARTRTQR